MRRDITAAIPLSILPAGPRIGCRTSSKSTMPISPRNALSHALDVDDGAKCERYATILDVHDLRSPSCYHDALLPSCVPRTTQLDI